LILFSDAGSLIRSGLDRGNPKLNIEIVITWKLKASSGSLYFDFHFPCRVKAGSDFSVFAVIELPSLTVPFATFRFDLKIGICRAEKN